MKMNLLSSIIIVILFVSCSAPTFRQGQISLIPKPVKFLLKEKSYQFKSNSSIVIQDDRQKKAANYLAGMLNRAGGFELSVTNEKSMKGVLFENIKGMPSEAYHLEVTPNQIVIKAAGEAGFFNAVQTIRQLLPPEIESKKPVKSDWVVPCAVIDDEPRFSWRGMQMDFSRHFFTVDEVKEFLDYMALYKLNIFHMHLTDDQGWRIEIKKYPLLTENGAWRIESNQDATCKELAKTNELFVIDEQNYHEINGQRMYGGFFTQEQIKEIVKYADDRCITVIPEIDMPGHFKSAIDNYLWLSCTGMAGEVSHRSMPACSGKETTYEFAENILAEVAGLFPGKYIHIGGDEVFYEPWKKCTDCQKEIKKNGLKDEHELQSHFNRRIESFLHSKGKRLMGWDEIIQGGLTKDASIMWWRNWAPKAPYIAVNNGNDIVISPDFQYYFDFLNEATTLKKVYNYEPVPSNFTTTQARHVIGIQANLWSERIPNFKRLEYQTFPRMLALAETAWSVNEGKNFDAFYQRVQKQYVRMSIMNIHYFIPAIEGLSKKIVFVDSAIVNLNLSLPLDGADIFYSLDGNVPTRNSLRYDGPFVVNKSGVIKARAYRGNVFNDLKIAEIEKQQYLEASVTTPENRGLQRWDAKGKFKAVEDVQLPASSKWAKVDKVEIGEFANQRSYSFVFKALFKAQKDGVYEFEIKSDGGSLIHFGDKLVLDNGGNHGTRKRSGLVALKKGWHPFTISYHQSNSGGGLAVWYAEPNSSLMMLDNSVCGF